MGFAIVRYFSVGTIGGRKTNGEVDDVRIGGFQRGRCSEIRQGSAPATKRCIPSHLNGVFYTFL